MAIKEQHLVDNDNNPEELVSLESVVAELKKIAEEQFDEHDLLKICENAIVDLTRVNVPRLATELKDYLVDFATASQIFESLISRAKCQETVFVRCLQTLYKSIVSQGSGNTHFRHVLNVIYNWNLLLNRFVQKKRQVQLVCCSTCATNH